MTTASNVPIQANKLDPTIEELCRSGWTCQLGGFISDLWVLVAIGLAVSTVIASIAYLKSAQSALEEEQSRTAAERDAFESFARRAADISAEAANAAGTTTGGAVRTISTPHASATALEGVRQAYVRR